MRFRINLIMEMVVSGAYTGHPDAHMMFSNIFIGWLFRAAV